MYWCKELVSQITSAILLFFFFSVQKVRWGKYGGGGARHPVDCPRPQRGVDSSARGMRNPCNVCALCGIVGQEGGHLTMPKKSGVRQKRIHWATCVLPSMYPSLYSGPRLETMTLENEAQHMAACTPPLSTFVLCSWKGKRCACHKKMVKETSKRRTATAMADT